MRVTFVYLTAFSRTGGLEMFNRSFVKALTEIVTQSAEGFKEIEVLSLHDWHSDIRYDSAFSVKSSKGNKWNFLRSFVSVAFQSNLLILGHYNLSIFGFLYKILRPSGKVILICHGVDIWYKKGLYHRLFMGILTKILAVSKYTKERIRQHYRDKSNKVIVFPNTLDAYFPLPDHFEKPTSLLEEYHLCNKNKIILTVARLSAYEKYKGYDQILHILPQIKENIPNVKYILAGKADHIEEKRIIELIEKLDLTKDVILSGFIPNNELINHYLLADIFVMPSKKEGFGIVFIEAMSCGLKVVAGNKDGSVDAVFDSQFGKLVDPDNKQELTKAIIDLLQKPILLEEKKQMQAEVQKRFKFEIYKDRLQKILAEVQDIQK